MCKHGTTVKLPVVRPAELSYNGVMRPDLVEVDACIAPIVAALNEAGILTANSCCGHGKGPGAITLHDGRELVIEPTVRRRA